MRKFLILLGISLCFVGVDIVAARLLKPNAPTTQEAVREVSVEVLAKTLAMAMKFRLHLPQRVDETTYLETIRADRDKIIYDLSTNKYGGEFDQMMDALHEEMSKTACVREDYRKLLAYGLTIEVEYISSNGKITAPIIVTPQMCGASAP